MDQQAGNPEHAESDSTQPRRRVALLFRILIHVVADRRAKDEEIQPHTYEHAVVRSQKVGCLEGDVEEQLVEGTHII